MNTFRELFKNCGLDIGHLAIAGCSALCPSVLWLFAFCLFLLTPSGLSADLPSMRLDRLRPLGAAAGTEVIAELSGAELEETQSLRFDHSGLRAEKVEGKERSFKIIVGKDIPTGTYHVWAVGRWGISNPRLFVVSNGLTDVVETEPNNDAATAQTVAVNSAINGDADGNGQDVFRFTATKGQRLTLDCMSGKLDTLMDATMTLSNSDGKLLAANGDYNGRDPQIDFIAPLDGEYLVTLHDLSYRGGFPYRLCISDRPQVECTFPRVVQAGQKVELTVLGRNLGAGATPSKLQIGGLPLDEFRTQITPFADVLTTGSYRFHTHPTDHSVLPTAATCTLTGFQSRGPVGVASPLVVVDSHVTLESEPNDHADTPQKISLPLWLSGRFDEPRDADWFEFEIEEGGQYAVDVYCERIAGRADPYIVVMDDKGNRVNELDDFGHRINAFDGHLRDPSGMVSLSAKRKYRILVQDRYRRGGPRYQYVLKVRKPVPDFYAAVIHSVNPGPGGTTVLQGGARFFDVIIHQTEGFNGSVTISAEDLPSGLHFAPTTINNNSRGTFVLWADSDAAEWTGSVNLVATGKMEGREIRREVRPYTRVWNNTGSSVPMRELPICIRPSAPFAMQFENEIIEAKAGEKVEVKLRLQRYWDDFKNEVTISALSFPGGFGMPNAKFSGDQSELSVTIDIQAGRPAGDYTMTVIGQAQVPFNKDPAAKERPNTLVSLPGRPITLRVLPAPKP